MKKQSVLLSVAIILSLFLLTACSGKVKNDLSKNHLRGKVKTMEEKIYNVIETSGGNKDSLDRIIFSKYDEKGNFIEECYYDSVGGYLGKYIYQLKSSFDTIEDFAERENYDQKVLINTIEYFENGEKVTTFNVNNTLVYTKISFYDINGNITFCVKIDSLGRIGGTKSEYDEKGNEIREVQLHPLESTFEPKSYQDLNWLELRYILKTYDKNNDITEERYFYGKASSPANKLNYKYEGYDKEGNWIKQITYLDDKPNSIVYRKMEYY